jgi:predicted aldo/keto reductase-like oxidoreductase
MNENKGVNRRQFIRNSALGLVGAGVASQTELLRAEEKKAAEPLKIKSYRLLGRTGFKASDISSGGPSKLPVLNALLDAGVNYIDTAESYSRGNSEVITGQGIKGRDRKKLFINSKLVIKKDETKESIIKRFRKCLERLDTEYLDCMMTHGTPNVTMVKYEPFHAAMKQMKAEGKLRFVGISNHGPRSPESDEEPMDKVLIAAALDGRFDAMLLVYNYAQKEMGERIMKVCKEKNIGVTLMKTNMIGRYLSMKERVEARKKKGEEVRPRMLDYLNRLKEGADKSEGFIKKYGLENAAEMRAACTRFGLAHPAVAALLARCNTFEDAEQFLALSGTTLSGMEEKKLAAFVEGPGRFYCRHACGLCESNCAHGVQVNTIMRYNHYFEAHRLEKDAMQKYAKLEANANHCYNCAGSCEKACPFGIPVQGLLTFAHENLNLA